jgi:phosphatidate cytidylyltransferase
MKTRIITAGAAVPLFLGAMWHSTLLFGCLMTLLSVLAVVEITKSVRSTGREICFPLAMAGPVYAAAAAMGGGKGTEWLTPGVYTFVLAFYGLLKARQPATAAGNGLLVVMARGAGAGVWTAMFAMPVLLRSCTTASASSRTSADWSLILVTTLCVWAADSFALFGGMAFGRNKMAPSISPNKTWEGAITGLVASALAGAFIGQRLSADPTVGVPVGLLAGIVGPVGDLFESWVKRRLGVKDMGGILPGHGGVMDRFDSYLFVCTAVWMFLCLRRTL